MARRKQLRGAEQGLDPLEAGPGAELADGRFVYRRRLGTGSTAVGILVADNSLGGAELVLKVAKDAEAGERLLAEAQILSKLENEDRIVTMHGVEVVGGRTALLLKYAGRTLWAEALTTRGRLSLDLLERWGTDLLIALVALERAGIVHRDIKPSNLGIYQSNSRADSHLVLFDFSIAGVDRRNVKAGSPPYLDPFLGIGSRRHYDSAAERYGAAVVLFEMATGRSPWYGADPNANPATVDDDVTLNPAMFEPTVAASMVQFFAAALSRGATKRPGTAEEMLQAWRRLFTGIDAEWSRQDSEMAADNADTNTALTAAGLGARAVSALAAAQVITVGELLALNSTRLNRLVAREAEETRKEIRERYQSWARRLGKQAVRHETLGLDDVLQQALTYCEVPCPRSGHTER